MKKILFILLILSLFLLNACSQQYVCPDGSIVSEPSMCPEEVIEEEPVPEVEETVPEEPEVKETVEKETFNPEDIDFKIYGIDVNYEKDLKALDFDFIDFGIKNNGNIDLNDIYFDIEYIKSDLEKSKLRTETPLVNDIEAGEGIMYYFLSDVQLEQSSYVDRKDAWQVKIDLKQGDNIISSKIIDISKKTIEDSVYGSGLFFSGLDKINYEKHNSGDEPLVIRDGLWLKIEEIEDYTIKYNIKNQNDVAMQHPSLDIDCGDRYLIDYSLSGIKQIYPGEEYTYESWNPCYKDRNIRINLRDNTDWDIFVSAER